MKMPRNMFCKTDVYKWTHHDMLVDGLTGAWSYLEARLGGLHGAVVWLGLQYYLLEYLAGEIFTYENLAEAKALHGEILHGPRFNEDGYRRLIEYHGGRLPLRIYAAPEGTVIPCGNVLMAAENTDPKVPWVTNLFEPLLTKVWYPTTVATVGYDAKKDIVAGLKRTGGDPALADYMLHDFGYRGVSSEESATIGGLAHLVNYKGTDNIEGYRGAKYYYGALPGTAASVAASEHFVMTAKGERGEIDLALKIIAKHQNQTLSLVGDSFSWYRFVDAMIDADEMIDRYHVNLVLRPDSVTPEHKTPTEVILWTLKRLKDRLKTTTTSTGHIVVKRPILWGDGLEPVEIRHTLAAVEKAGFAVQNLVYGMGGGLLQKVNRDTDRFAFKNAAQCQDGVWVDIQKKPLQASKASKAGRLKLVRDYEGFKTVAEGYPCAEPNLLRPVFENGFVLHTELFSTIQARTAAALRDEVAIKVAVDTAVDAIAGAAAKV